MLVQHSRLLRILILSLVFVLSSCAEPKSPEEQVRAVIGQMEQAAESRDVRDVTARLSPHYKDAHGNGSADVERILRGYFIANQSIHLLTRVSEISFPQENEARATLLVGMVGRDAEAANAWNLAAEVYEFEVVLLQEEGNWKVSWARLTRD